MSKNESFLLAKKFFWLHIKKSGGQSIRAALKPYYREVDRANYPENFIQAQYDEYNDILNNYRTVLGKYQFKRSLFAKNFLYKNNWDNIESFAFSRQPIDRVISMFFYLFWHGSGITANLKKFAELAIKKKWALNSSYAFDIFLDYVQQARQSNSIFTPIDLHFTTHTATMFDDITDENGKILLKKTYRLENFAAGINEIFEICGINKRVKNNSKMINKNNSKPFFSLTKSQILKIEDIYKEDFEIYETSY